MMTIIKLAHKYVHQLQIHLKYLLQASSLLRLSTKMRIFWVRLEREKSNQRPIIIGFHFDNEFVFVSLNVILKCVVVTQYIPTGIKLTTQSNFSSSETF